MNGDKAWNIGADGQPTPQLANAEERQIQIWMTPHGFVKGAIDAGNATLTPGTDGTNVITSHSIGKTGVTGTIDAQGVVTKV